MTTDALGTDNSAFSDAPVVVGLGRIPVEVVGPILEPGFTFVPSPDAQALRKAQAAIVRASEIIDTDKLSQMPNLRLLVRTGVGYDSVDTDAARLAGVDVGITPGTNTKAVAEGAFGHILHLIKNLGALTEVVRKGGWAERVDYTVGDLEGSTLGIIGYGRIGQRMHSIAGAFDMKVLAFDSDAEVPTDVKADFNEVISGSDIISVHVPLLPSTRNLISTAEIDSMRAGTVLVNVSRGGIVDEDAAHEGLKSGQLAGVGLDVFNPEPPNDHPLFHHRNVVLTPHVLGISEKAARANCVAAANSIRSYFNGGQDFTLVT